MARYQPLFIDFSGKKVVVFGGGKVGERKAAYFAGAQVTVISQSFTAGLEARKDVSLARRTVMAEDVPVLIEGAFLVVAATGDEALDAAIVRAAGAAGILANAVDGGSEVILPAKIERGEITVAVSTGGRSPAMARFVRQRLEESLGDELSDMVRLQAELRELLKEKVRSQDQRERMLRKVLEDRAIWAALNTSYENAKHLAIEKLINSD